VPEQPAQQETFDLVVVGGYPAAIRAAWLGLRAALVEKERPGGVCLHWGCIPMGAAMVALGLPAHLPRPRRR
jgi:pyruvate/2-oxoglutarate dehydrogenase complex dihydrolipoamide dehydrogenase (E3) component